MTTLIVKRRNSEVQFYSSLKDFLISGEENGYLFQFQGKLTKELIKKIIESLYL